MIIIIPKIIHGFWFGRNEKPKLIQKCINSWYEKCPDYEIKIWTEDNWDVNKYKYSKQAYDAKKWAFVTDLCRLDILYNEGGITLDSDVEILKPFSDEMLSHKGFTSTESANRWISATIASEKEHPFIKSILKWYKQNDFVFDPKNICNTVIIDKLAHKWYEKTVGDKIFLAEDFCIYPRTWLECKNWSTGQIELTKDSYCIHHYTFSWG